jgi:hypothetical protein
MGRHPSETGAVKLTVALPLPAEAEAMSGASGGVTMATLLEEVEGTLSPRALVAVTVKV